MSRSEGLTVRAADPGDLAAILDLYLHLTPNNTPFPLDRAQDIFTDFLGYKGSAILLGEVDETIVCSCVLLIVPNLTRGGAPYGLIENVVTHSAHRGHGYGTHILAAATARAWDAGCYKVMLMTGKSDPKTLGFYERAGFEQSKTGFQKRRSPDR